MARYKAAIHLTMKDIGSLLALAATIDPDEFDDDEAIAMIYRARHVVDASDGGLYRLRVSKG